MNQGFIDISPVQYPLAEFARIMLFSSEDAARQFCEHYGVSVDMDNRLTLNERMPIMPEETLKPCRAPHIIDSKRTAPLSEVTGYAPSYKLELLDCSSCPAYKNACWQILTPAGVIQ